MSLREVLLAVGFSLIMLGIFLRGIARSHRRTLAARKQHELDVRATGAPLPPGSHLDRHFPRYANGVVAAGLIAVVAGCLI